MLTIRKEQVDALAAEADRSFVARETERLARLFAGALPVSDPAFLPEWIEAQIARALRWNIRREPEVEDYLDLCVLAPDLAGEDPRPRLRQIFADRALPSFRKIRLAQNEVLFLDPSQPAQQEVSDAGHE